MSKPTCETCRFWDSPEGKTGECRRHAPTVRLAPREEDAGVHYAEWPLTFRNDWCGEHQPNPEV